MQKKVEKYFLTPPKIRFNNNNICTFICLGKLSPSYEWIIFLAKQNKKAYIKHGFPSKSIHRFRPTKKEKKIIILLTYVGRCSDLFAAVIFPVIIKRFLFVIVRLFSVRCVYFCFVFIYFPLPRGSLCSVSFHSFFFYICVYTFYYLSPSHLDSSFRWLISTHWYYYYYYYFWLGGRVPTYILYFRTIFWKKYKNSE